MPISKLRGTPSANRIITEAGIPQTATVTHEGGIQEQLGLEIWLQEGLEGRIIDEALDKTSRAIDTVLRKR